MNENKLMELTPDKWGLLVYLSQYGMVDLDKVKTVMKEIANSRLEFAEETLNRAIATILLIPEQMQNYAIKQ